MPFLLDHAYSFYFGFAAFLIFFIILAKYGVKPIVAAIDAREAKISKELSESQDAYAKAQTLKQQLDQQLKNAESRISEMMAEANRDAEARKTALLDQGRVELDGMRGRALREIEAARQGAILNLRAEVADIATTVAEKILKERLDSGRHEQLVTQAIDAYEGAAARSGRG